MEQEKTNRIGQDFTLFGLLRFVFPSIMNNIFTQIFRTLDDGLFVSRFVGKTALAGINILSPLHFIQFSINNLFAIGINAIIAFIRDRVTKAGSKISAYDILVRSICRQTKKYRCCLWSAEIKTEYSDHRLLLNPEGSKNI